MGILYSKASGFSQHDGVKAGKNKLRFVVPETVDTTKSTFISVKQEWFETSRMGKITDIKAKQGKYLALDFTDRKYDSEVFTIYTKNWFGIKREHDVIVDYSNFLRVFFPEPHTGEVPRDPIILPYSKLKTEYKHIYEELYKMNGFVAFDKDGLASGQPVSKDDVFTKENAKGRAFIVNNNTHISLIYDFVLPGIFKNQTQKTQVFDYIEKSTGKFKTYDPEKQGIDIKFNTAPFYISKFLGWYYIDPTGNRVDLKPGEEVLIPKWVKSELRLIARYDITTDTDKIGPELDKQGLVAISYFDGPQRVIFDIVKKRTPLKEHIYQKEGYAYVGWYKDSALTEKVDFTKELATTHTVLYLKSTKINQPQPEKPVQYHTVNFITPSDANQLLPTKRAHGQKLETNYLTPSLVSRLDEHGNLEELDYWNLVDPITGTKTKFDFNTPITEDITLEAVMRKRVVPNSKYTIKRYFESVEHAGNFLEDKTKEEVVEGNFSGQVVELSPTQTNAPYGFTLDSTSVLKKKINKDGTTVFELKYKRNRYQVNFEVNYNGNHFKGVTTSSEPSQTVVHEGKLTKPANPTITKAGYTYVFKHWQLKDEMGNVYREVSEFDFTNTKITKNTTLVAYFEEKQANATYTVKHIFQGISGQIDERIEEDKISAQVGKSITVTQENRNKAYDKHFQVADFTETKKVEADGSSIFEIRYARKKYRVNFVVNFNNHFAGAIASVEAEQEIHYEGKVKKPEFSPSLAKAGHTYTFKHWQLKDEMGNVYRLVSAFDFNTTKITKNITLVAYFEETAKTVNYTIKHIFEGVGTIPETTEKEVKTAQVGTQITVNQSNGFNKPGFELKPQSEIKVIEENGQTTFTLRYQRKTYTVDFNYNTGVLNGQSGHTDTYKFEQLLRDPQHPEKLDPTHLKTYTFVGWENEETGEILDFSQNIKVTKNLKLKARWTEATATRLVYLKLIWETLSNQPDETKELVSNKPRAIGEIARATDADIQAILTRFQTNSPHPYHQTTFDLANSTTELILTSSTQKQYLTLYFKAKTYTVDFDYSDLKHSSVDDALKSTITLKYTQALSQDLVQKMQAVRKQPTLDKDYVFDKLIDKATGDEFDPTVAYNQNVSIKPVFKEKEVVAEITPRVADFDEDKVDLPTWPNQTVKVGTKFSFQPTTNIKPGWKFIGWSKTPGGSVEEITVARNTKEVYAVFEPGDTTYTIKHIFEGIAGEIQERTETTVKSSKTYTLITVTKSDRLSGYDHGFTVKTAPQTLIVQADGTTTFTLRYSRKEFTVNYIVNYKDQFTGNISQTPVAQKVKYEGKAQNPGATSIEKNGRTYTFKHWQLESSMNGTYTEQTAYDFTSKVTKDITLVAYFKETIHKVNYKIIHYLEKQGESEALNGTYDEIVEEQIDQLVENKAKYKKYSALDENLYEVDNTKINVLEHDLAVGDNSVRVYQYYKLKETKVEFKGDSGVNSIADDSKLVKKTRAITLPGYTLKSGYDFVGWSSTLGGNVEAKFIATGTSMQIYARTEVQSRKITYTIRKEQPDGSFVETTEIKTGKINSVHAVEYTNYDYTAYQNIYFSTSSLTVNLDESLNKVTVTLIRRVHSISFVTKGHSYTISPRNIKHGAKIGEISEEQFKLDGMGIIKLELDSKVKTKIEVENFVVLQNHQITVYVDEPTKFFGKYPQTKVENPEGIEHIKDEVQELKFNSLGNDYKINFTRHYYQDSQGNQYEKYNNKYFLIEDVAFVKFPGKKSWLTKKIIDAAPYNLYHNTHTDNAKPENSILKGMIENIGKVLGGEVFMPTYGDDEFGSLSNHSRLGKLYTDYAYEVLTQHSGHVAVYRDTDLKPFSAPGIKMPEYSNSSNQYWWVGTQYKNSNEAWSLQPSGVYYAYNIYWVMGVVVAIR